VTVVVEEYLATGGDAGACALVGVEDTIRNLSAGEVSFLGDAKRPLGDAQRSLGDAKRSLGDV
jgi:hypothetical protein